MNVSTCRATPLSSRAAGRASALRGRAPLEEGPMTDRSSARYVISFNMGGTNARCGLVDTQTACILFSVEKPTSKGSRPYNVTRQMQRMVAKVKKWAHANGINDDEILGVAAGTPGQPNPLNGRSIWENHPGGRKKGIRVGGVAQAFLNDGDASALGAYALVSEVWRLLKNGGVLVGLTVGTGIGVGVWTIQKTDGSLDFSPISSEGGHIKVPSAAGEPCGCGEIGCVEAIASCSAQERLARKLAIDVLHNFSGHKHLVGVGIPDPLLLALLNKAGRPESDLHEIWNLRSDKKNLSEAIDALPMDAALIDRLSQQGDPFCIKIMELAGRALAEALASWKNHPAPLPGQPVVFVLMGGGANTPDNSPFMKALRVRFTEVTGGQRLNNPTSKALVTQSSTHLLKYTGENDPIMVGAAKWLEIQKA